MEPRTLEALKASIAKWERNAEAKTPDDIKLGSDECPLCVLFNKRTDYSQFCRGCPVYAKTGEQFCSGTPYKYAVGMSSAIGESWVKAAREEVDFLKSLLPAEEAP